MFPRKTTKIASEPKAKVVAKPKLVNLAQPVEPVKMAAVEETKPGEAPLHEVKAEESNPRSSIDRGTLLLGATLLVAGVVWILSLILDIPLMDYLWPLAIIIPGVLVFISALNMESGAGGAFSILGGILTSVGVLLFVQNLTGLWASWAYAWSLIAPTSIGISQVIYGAAKKRDSLVNTGKQMVKVGLSIFAVGFVFFELIIGLNGFGLTRFGLPAIPVVLIGLGVFILVRAIFFRR